MLPSDEFLLEQYITLRRQIPLMYALMFINVVFLGVETFRDVPLNASFAIPALLSAAIALRSALWFRRRYFVPTPETVKVYFRSAVITAAALSIAFGIWGVLLFSETDRIRSASTSLYVFVGAISCCFCLQALPRAGHFILIFGAMPVTVRLLLSSDWSLFSIGANFLIVALLILRTLSTSHTGFKQVLESRSVMLAEQNRARAAEQEAQHLAYLDPLTGLKNRRALCEFLDAHVATKPNIRLYLFMLALDRFKGINDAHGHGAGDRLLRAVSERLANALNKNENIYRLGGDEFAVLINEFMGGNVRITELADQLIQEITAPFHIDGFSHHISASIGISTYPTNAVNRETLMQQADIAMYEAKSLGRSRDISFEPIMGAKLATRAILEREVRDDILTNAFVPYYQPILNLGSGSLEGFEMLVRWNRADGANVGPNEFIPVVEECGLIGELMLQLLNQACIDAAQWPQALTIAINVSPIQFRDPWLSEKILGVLTRQGFPARRIVLEITENAIISDPAAAKRTIE